MDVSLATLLLSAASGVVVGLFLAVFGGGGSVLAAPLLIYVVGIRDPHVAIGTSAAGVALNALAGLSQSALSQHLALLREEGLVATRREGQSIFYRIHDPAVLRVIATLAAIYCPPEIMPEMLKGS